MIIDENTRNEIIINKSRFITYLYRIDSKEDILNILNNFKKEYKDATHIVYAYILDNEIRFNDDNEPSGTSGLPILEVLKKNNLNHVICVCIRYFGGIKLGAGGLIRAYSNSCSLALKKVNLIKYEKLRKVKVTFKYNLKTKIDNLLNEDNIIDKIFDDNITYYLLVNDKLKQELSNLVEVKELND